MSKTVKFWGVFLKVICTDGASFISPLPGRDLYNTEEAALASCAHAARALCDNAKQLAMLLARELENQRGAECSEEGVKECINFVEVLVGEVFVQIQEVDAAMIRTSAYPQKTGSRKCPVCCGAMKDACPVCAGSGVV